MRQNNSRTSQIFVNLIKANIIVQWYVMQAACDLLTDNAALWWFVLLCTSDHDETSVSETYARHAGRQSTADERQRVEDDERERTRSGGFASEVSSVNASLISDSDGKEYQRIEYTPYGETWVERTSNTGMEYLPYKFTGKEQDEETGLYYFGARYLDPQYSRWLSTDPALSDYIPLAPLDDNAKRHNENLPGMGGVYNTVNLQLYHYSANNPVTYTDPNGEFVIMAGWSTTAGAGNAVSDNTGFFVCIPGDGKPVTVGVYTVNATGAYLGYGISAGGEITLAPFADEFSDISGFSMVGGESGLKFSALPMITWGLEVGANPYSETLGDFIQSITIAVSGTKSLSRVPSTPIEGHLYTAWTKKIWEVEVGEAKTKITQTVNKYLDRKDYEGLVNYLKQLHKSLVPACEE